MQTVTNGCVAYLTTTSNVLLRACWSISATCGTGGTSNHRFQSIRFSSRALMLPVLLRRVVNGSLCRWCEDKTAVGAAASHLLGEPHRMTSKRDFMFNRANPNCYEDRITIDFWLATIFSPSGRYSCAINE